MKILFTSSCKHLMPHASSMDLVVIRHFPDGEIDIHLPPDIQKNEDVWVIASINTSQAFIELLMVLDILSAKDVRIFLILTYVFYLRNGKTDQSSFGQTLLELIQRCGVEKIIVLHPHAMNIESHKIEIRIWNDFFAECARDFDVLVAPDRGARAVVEVIGKITNKPTLFLEKRRNDNGSLEIAPSASLNGERVLILDDMISTGGTVIKASEILKNAGASYVGAAATHGIFCNDALQRLKVSSIAKIFVTDTLHIPPEEQLIICSIVPFINQLIKSTP